MENAGHQQEGVGDRHQLADPAKQDAPNQVLTIGQTGVYPQFILFGDSLTQGSMLTVQPRMQHLYIRRADIVNRGFSGYNTALALSALKSFLPSSNPAPATIEPAIRLATVFFGANDAAVPENAQHVPLLQYIDNLRYIAEYPVFKRHGTKIVLVTPTPVNEWLLSKPLTRTAENTKRYAQGVRQLAKELRLPCVDLWTAFMKRAGYPNPDCKEYQAHGRENGEAIETHITNSVEQHKNDIHPLPGSQEAPPSEVLATLMYDGLHLTPQAYDIFYEELLSVILTEIPECAPENIPSCFRPWRNVLGVPYPA